MRTYRYRALDRAGRPQEGIIQANDPRSAQQLLSQRGLLVQHIVVVEPVSSASVSVQSESRQGVRSHPHPWEHSKLPPHAMMRFLWQLRAFLGSGTSLAEAFRALSGRVRPKRLVNACATIAGMTAQGVSLSDAMATFSDLFPRFLVGAIRAGEYGGYLPEAIDRLIEYYANWHRISRWQRLPKVVLGFTAIALPLVVSAGYGLLLALPLFKGTEQTFGESFSLILKGWGIAFSRVGLPIMGLFIGMWLLYRWLGRTELVRARWQLNAPFLMSFGGWVRMQSLQLFLHHLTRLSSAGVSPVTAWELASNAVPNYALATALQSISLESGHHLDTALSRSYLFAPHEVSLVSQGIREGNLVEALHRLTGMYQAQGAEELRRIPKGFGLIALLLLVGSSVVAFLGFIAFYFRGVFTAVEEWMKAP